MAGTDELLGGRRKKRPTTHTLLVSEPQPLFRVISTSPHCCCRFNTVYLDSANCRCHPPQAPAPAPASGHLAAILLALWSPVKRPCHTRLPHVDGPSAADWSRRHILRIPRLGYPLTQVAPTCCGRRWPGEPTTRADGRTPRAGNPRSRPRRRQTEKRTAGARNPRGVTQWGPALPPTSRRRCAFPACGAGFRSEGSGRRWPLPGGDDSAPRSSSTSCGYLSQGIPQFRG